MKTISNNSSNMTIIMAIINDSNVLMILIVMKW
jgi:hypothetical protein